MAAFAVVKSDGLNVRINSHADAGKITALSKGDKVPVLDRRDFGGGHTWIKVELKDGRTGWVYAKYVTVESKLPDEEPVVPDIDFGISGWIVGAIIGLCAVIVTLVLL